MAEEQPEVRVRLVVDDQSDKQLDRFRQSMDKSHASTKRVEGGHKDLSGEIAKGTATGMAHFELMKRGYEKVVEAVHMAVEAVVEFAHESIAAADAAVRQEKAMAGILSMADQGKHTMGQLRDYAEGVREDLEYAGLAAGVATEDMVAAFNAVAERGAMGSEAARELTEQMSIVGKVVPAGMQGLSEGFANLEAGIVRARNPIVQLIAATGVLHGNAKAVAAQMQKLTPEEQIKRGEEAIRRQAATIAKGGAGPASLGSLETSFRGFKEMFAESLGRPVLAEMVKSKTALRDWLLAHIDAIKSYGERIGEALAGGLRTAQAAGHAIVAAGKALYDYGQRASAQLTQTGVLMRHVWREAGDIAARIERGMGRAADMIKHAFERGDGVMGRILKGFDRVAGMVGHAVGADAGEAREKYRQVAATPQTSPAEMALARREFEQMAAAAKMDAGAVKIFELEMEKAREQTLAAASAVAQSTNVGDLHLETLSGYFDEAIRTHNEGALRYAIQVLDKSQIAQQAFVDGAVNIDGGFSALIRTLDEKAPELAKKLRGLADTVRSEGGVKAIGGPTVNFNGGQSFNIKQDFRDQDPDRVAVVFRRDVLRAAEARRQSRMATPFGL